MKRFGDYFQPKSRKFVALELEEGSRAKLQSWANFMGFDTVTSYSGDPITEMDYHITVFYSENTSSIPTGIFHIPMFEVRPLAFDLLGEEKNIPVLIIEDSLTLKSYYDQYKAKGLQTKWSDWKVHISISYKYDGNPNIEELPLPPFPIKIDKIKVDDIPEEKND